jgi:hypothetical protein
MTAPKGHHFFIIKFLLNLYNGNSRHDRKVPLACALKFISYMNCISILLSLIMCIIIGYNQLHYARQSFQCDVHKIYSTHRCQEEWLHIEIQDKCAYKCTQQYHSHSINTWIISYLIRLYQLWLFKCCMNKQAAAYLKTLYLKLPGIVANHTHFCQHNVPAKILIRHYPNAT